MKKIFIALFIIFFSCSGNKDFVQVSKFNNFSNIFSENKDYLTDYFLANIIPVAHGHEERPTPYKINIPKGLIKYCPRGVEKSCYYYEGNQVIYVKYNGVYMLRSYYKPKNYKFKVVELPIMDAKDYLQYFCEEKLTEHSEEGQNPKISNKINPVFRRFNVLIKYGEFEIYLFNIKKKNLIPFMNVMISNFFSDPTNFSVDSLKKSHGRH